MASNNRGCIWIGDLLPECDDQDLMAYFGKFGQVREAKIEREKRTQLARGFGFLKMGSQMLVDKVLKAQHRIWEHDITVKLASEVTIEEEPTPPHEIAAAAAAKKAGEEREAARERARNAPREDGDEKSGQKRAADDVAEGDEEPGKFFIAGLAEGTEEEQIKDYFATFGEVSEVSIAKDAATGKSKNYAFITMADPSSDKQIADQEHEISGKKVDLKKCVKKGKRARDGAQDNWKSGRDTKGGDSKGYGGDRGSYGGGGGKVGYGDGGKGGYGDSSKGGYGGRGYDDNDRKKSPYGDDRRGGYSEGGSKEGGGYGDRGGTSGYDRGGGGSYGGGKSGGKDSYDRGGGGGGWGDDSKGKGKDGGGKGRDDRSGYGGGGGSGGRYGGSDSGRSKW